MINSNSNINIINSNINNNHNHNPIVLGIESSCDDSCVAIINANKEILSNIVISQNNEHAQYKGVMPEIAARSHIKNLQYAANVALKEAELSVNDLDCIAATSGPGLIGGVMIGSTFGKSIASVLHKPFIAINHLEGHALAPQLTENLHYPYLLLLISGGHCQLVIVKNLGSYKVIGKTLDDAVGEAFDKVANMLNLGFPGGPLVEKAAINGDCYKYILPQPLSNRLNCDFSFSGLKTAVKILISKLGSLNEQKISNIAASFQYTVASVLKCKILIAIQKYENAFNHGICNKVIVLSGGVASNLYIRSVLTEAVNDVGYTLIAPPINLCTDNAAMIAYAGLERLRAGLISDLNFRPRARWSLEDL